MKRYFSAFLVTAAAMAGCTSVDDTLGQDYITPQQQMRLHFETLKDASAPFTVRLGLNDSVPASNQGVIFIGQKDDAVFGKTRAAAMTDFFPSTTTFNDSKYFGSHAVADSVYLDIMINDVVGDASVAQTFNIYYMTDSLLRDSVYRMGTPGPNAARPDLPQKTLLQMIDPAKPLFSFELSDKIPVGALALLKLTPTAEGQAFMKRLTEVPNNVNATPWPQFRKDFNGLYIAPADPTKYGAVYELELRNSFAGLYLWFHNYTEEYNPATPDKFIADTAYVTYDFSDSNWYADNRVVNVNINSMTHEYPFTVTDAVVAEGYVQSLGGVGMRLKTSPELLAWLETLKENGVSRAVINRALLTIPIEQPSLGVALNSAPTRLGMYYWFGAGTPIADYDYVYEYNNSSSFIPYGGYLQRSRGCYEMNIKAWLTQLMLNPAVAEKEIWLGPAIVTRANEFDQVKLSVKMKLDVIYTLTKE